MLALLQPFFVVSADNRPHGEKPFSGPVAVALQEKLADLLRKLIPEHRLAEPAHLVHSGGLGAAGVAPTAEPHIQHQPD